MCCQQLFEEGFITQADLKERRLQLIDELTGTSSRTNSTDSSSPSTTVSTATTRGSPGMGMGRTRQCCPRLKSRGEMLPDFSFVKSEAAVKHVFDYETRSVRMMRMLHS